jgi:nucleoside-diphosphate-sugar epimerase
MKIFVTGATGYIGGEVAALLAAAGHAVRGLTRSEEKAAQLHRRGIAPVIGTLEDGDRLAAEARAADAVVNAADSDHAGAVEALLAGLAGSAKPFLHTSGISILADRAMGGASERVFDEETPFEPDPGKAARVAIDRRVLAAKGVRACVICNSLVYGRGQGLHPESIQLPILVAEARRAGVARYVGRGANIWSNVHIADVGALYLLALERAPAGSFFFAENGEASFKALAEALSRRLGLGDRTESWPVEEAVAALGFPRAIFSLASNCRVRGRRARELLGWAPRHDSIVAAIEAGDF